MLATDLTELSMRLTQLAHALNGKPPTKDALKVWLDALAECVMPDVLAVLTEWPKSHAKPPVPVEVLKLARERASDRIECEAKSRARDAQEVWSPDNLRGNPNSPAYLQFKADAAALAKQPAPHPRVWATRLRDKAARGETLMPAQELALREYARKYAFVPANADVTWSTDEREARAEREAIQAEPAPF